MGHDKLGEIHTAKLYFQVRPYLLYIIRTALHVVTTPYFIGNTSNTLSQPEAGFSSLLF